MSSEHLLWACGRDSAVSNAGLPLEFKQGRKTSDHDGVGRGAPKALRDEVIAFESDPSLGQVRIVPLSWRAVHT